MTVGLPGTGIGGLFYLLSGLLMPIHALYRRLRGAPGAPSRGIVVRQTTLAVFVLGAIWATGWLIGLVIQSSPRLAAAREVLAQAGGGAMRGNVVAASAVLLGVGTLVLVLVSVEVARLLVAGRAPLETVPAPETAAARRLGGDGSGV